MLLSWSVIPLHRTRTHSAPVGQLPRASAAPRAKREASASATSYRGLSSVSHQGGLALSRVRINLLRLRPRELQPSRRQAARRQHTHAGAHHPRDDSRLPRLQHPHRTAQPVHTCRVHRAQYRLVLRALSLLLLPKKARQARQARPGAMRGGAVESPDWQYKDFRIPTRTSAFAREDTLQIEPSAYDSWCDSGSLERSLCEGGMMDTKTCGNDMGTITCSSL